MEIQQTAFVVRNIEESIRHWTTFLAAGPFYLTRPDIGAQTYRGAPTKVDVTMAHGFLGDTWIELIEQHNDAPSAYRDGLPAPEDIPVAGHFNHYLMKHEDYDRDYRRFLDAGAEVCFDAVTTGGRFCYLDARKSMGCHVELVEDLSGFMPIVARVREAHRDWDGSRPLRNLEELF